MNVCSKFSVQAAFQLSPVSPVVQCDSKCEIFIMFIVCSTRKRDLRPGSSVDYRAGGRRLKLRADQHSGKVLPLLLFARG